MKTISDIISHFRKSSSVSKINEFRCFARLKEALPNTLQSHIKFMYKRGDTLFFVLDHPAIAQEFQYKINLINNLLKMLAKDNTCSTFAQVIHIKKFVSHSVPKIKKIYKVEEYKERAYGNFENKAKDEHLHALFDEIKQTLHG